MIVRKRRHFFQSTFPLITAWRFTRMQRATKKSLKLQNIQLNMEKTSNSVLFFYFLYNLMLCPLDTTPRLVIVSLVHQNKQGWWMFLSVRAGICIKFLGRSRGHAPLAKFWLILDPQEAHFLLLLCWKPANKIVDNAQPLIFWL